MSTCIDAARARGLTGRHVVLRHVLPMTLGLFFTMLALDLAGLIAGAVLLLVANALAASAHLRVDPRIAA